MWKQLSDELSAAVARTANQLVHIGGSGVPGRTGLVWGPGLVLTLAQEAEDGESVPVVLPGGKAVPASVRAWDPRTGLTLLAVPELSAPAWTPGPLPRLGSLALTVAFPSPQGPEARLDLVRFVDGKTEWGRGVALDALVQTDGAPWPGFLGAAVVDSDGHLLGVVAANQRGNGSFVVPASDLVRLAEGLSKNGTPKRARLGVSTRPSGGQGASLVGVDESGPAWTSGWREGDLLVRLAGESIAEPSDLVRVLGSLVPGTRTDARLVRRGELLELPVVPGEL